MPQGQCRRATVGTAVVAATAARGDGKGYTEYGGGGGETQTTIAQVGVSCSNGHDSNTQATDMDRLQCKRPPFVPVGGHEATAEVTGRTGNGRGDTGGDKREPLPSVPWVDASSSLIKRKQRGVRQTQWWERGGGTARGGIATAAWRQRAGDGSTRGDDDGSIREKGKRVGGDDS
ncbi:hypothetical protein BGW80DRAFT_1255279 [Lactifluus volemus]|nr:hypothetical protein BGW80DRAFT_1255279 [Lactifluus volemus]